jgi:hypothetical protein
VASSDTNAAQIDELQYGLDHGPCLTALRTGELVRIDDLAGEQRWGDRPYFFGQAQTRLAGRFAQDAAIAVGIAARLAAQSVLTGQLRASLASRAVIDQAIGVIMAEQRCTATDAFAILRAASQNRNIKLRQVAEQIVIGITGSPPQPPPFHPPA